MSRVTRPQKQGLYDPRYEHDACGVGFLVNIKGEKSNQLVRQAIQLLLNLAHRGACGCEANTGDGAGILLQLPHPFLRKAAAQAEISLPEPESYGVGMIFLPRAETARRECETIINTVIPEEGQTLLGWRTLKTDDHSLGNVAKAAEPVIRQVFIGRGNDLGNLMDFERKLYVIRRRIENAVWASHIEQKEIFYIPSMSAKTIVYKGMLLTEQLDEFYPDLGDPDMESALALVHSRFSTNTFPSWDRAHPYRTIIHNGEINTLRGNINWMHARQAMFESELFGDDIKKILPIIDPNGSDSAMFDNCLEFLTLAGWPLQQAMMMMIPEPWSKHESMSDEKKAFYEFHSCLMEPWDGPASIAFTDGIKVGAVLDRNGLRPSRYYVTKDGYVIMGSEVGVLDVPPENVLYKGRLEPGRMFFVDTEEGRIVSDEEIKDTMSRAQPYRRWLNQNVVPMESLPRATNHGEKDAGTEEQNFLQLQQAFGYTFEELRLLIQPMAATVVEARGSMGNDAPVAVLSDRTQLLYNYFRQLFAQVTNPPIDAIREELVTSTEMMLGPEGNLLQPTAASCRKIRLPIPILTNEELDRIRHADSAGFSTVTLPILFTAAEATAGLEAALERLFTEADKAVEDGVDILILCDRGVDKHQAPIPALLAISGLHHHLIRNGTRTRVGLVIESAEPRIIHHFALLIGYGATAVNPYLAFASLRELVKDNLAPDMPYEEVVQNYVKAAVKGVVKVLSKMGISTIQSYCGAQIFEAVGLTLSFIDTYFTWTASRMEGVGLDVIAQEALQRHEHAFSERHVDSKTLDVGGEYQWRHNGERHLFNPETVHTLQRACRHGDYKVYQKYARMINDQSTTHYTLRGLLDFKPLQKPVPIEEVEPVEAICRRFKTGAMSYGSISQEAHEALAIAMNRIGGKSNTGEGGEDPARYKLDPNGDSRNSAIKQVASGRFGVTSEYLVNAQELQIKMAQGAKPGEGGELPGRKVYPWIAKVRSSTPGVGLISPPPHHDIYSIEDLAELIHDLKNGNRNARINVKLVAEVGVGTIAAGVAKGRADVVLISGHDGGTGASPQTSIKHAGMPWELGLAETHQTLVLNDLRSRIVVETDGQLKTGRDVAIAALLGAEEFGFSTAPLVSMGCIMMRVCHLDTCPVGVATQNPELRKKFTGSADHVVHFMKFIAQELREIMAELGFRTINEMVGRTDCLETQKAISHWKAKGLDFTSILHQPDVSPTIGRYCQIPQDHGLEKSLDMTTLLDLCRPAIERGERVEATLPIRNIHRVVGTIVGSDITKTHGPAGLPEDTINIHFKGSAGQSFAAFMPKGMTFVLEGDANDYFAKGLSGGKVIAYPPEGSTFKPEENIIIGNVSLYGATSGEAYIRGMAGERFCVRNSGVHAVIEAVGDHGCEYMTGGRVVVLGATGRNFAAGMSGGIAYVLDKAGDFVGRCNTDMVSLEKLEDEEEIADVKAMIRRHAEWTKSELAWRVLATWEALLDTFVKVIPKDYKRMLQAIQKAEASGLTSDDAMMMAFRENVLDVARVSGN